MVSSYLLSLPPELRLRIYDFVVSNNPLTKPPSHYTGLLYCCREIRSEFEPEIVKRMTACLLERQTKCRQVFRDDMQFIVPRSLNEVHNLRVFRPDEPGMFDRSDPFLALMYMHFNTLTITTPLPSLSTNISPVPRPAARVASPHTQYSNNTRRLARWISRQEHYIDIPAAERIICDWSADPQGRANVVTWDCMQVLRYRDYWGGELCEDGERRVIGAVFINGRRRRPRGLWSC